MSGVMRLALAKKTDGSFNTGGFVSDRDLANIPNNKAKGPKMQSFAEMNGGMSKKIS